MPWPEPSVSTRSHSTAKTKTSKAWIVATGRCLRRRRHRRGVPCASLGPAIVAAATHADDPNATEGDGLLRLVIVGTGRVSLDNHRGRRLTAIVPAVWSYGSVSSRISAATMSAGGCGNVAHGRGLFSAIDQRVTHSSPSGPA